MFYRNEKNQSYFEELLVMRKNNVAFYILSYKEVMYDVISDEYMSLKLIYYWVDDTKKLADTLIESGLRLNASLPLLQEAIRSLNYDAVQWLLDQGVSPVEKYIDPTGTDALYEGTPLDVVNDTEHRLLNYAGKDYKYEENDPEVVEIEKLLKETIEKNANFERLKS